VTSYRNSHTGRETGAEYTKQFSDPFNVASIYWSIEKSLLTKSLSSKRRRHVLDFACGTGRVAGFLYKNGYSVVGVDISASMLKVAEVENNGPEYVLNDITVNDWQNECSSFEIISAFRFFPHAEPELREEAMGCIRSAISPGGLFIVNHHRNPQCIWRIIATTLGVSKSEACGFTSNDLVELAKRHGFTLSKKISYGFLPLRSRSSLPFGIATILERFLASVFGHTNNGRCIYYVFTPS